MGNIKLFSSLFIASVLLTACQGQNPFKRQSDPTKKYPHTMESSNRPYVPGQKPAGTPKGAGTDGGKPVAVEIPCFDPVKIEVEPDHGNLLLKFAEETESSYNLKITLKGPNALTGKIIANNPEDSELILTARQDNVYVYKFTWKPAKGASASKATEMSVGLDGEPAKGACANAKNRLAMSLVVSKTNDTPSVSFSGIKEKIKFGESFDFNVIVDDPTASKGKTPVIKSIKFSEAKGSAVLDGTAAVTSCDENKVLSPTKYEFVCRFDSNLIKGVEKLLSTGKQGVTSFTVTAASKDGVLSAPTPQKIKVVFEKIETGAKK